MNGKLDHNCTTCSMRSPLFDFLNNDELERISLCKKRVLFKTGEIIVKQGTPVSHVISFTSGIAKVYIEGANNRNLILQFIKPTQFLGSPGIYVDSIHHFSVVAVEESSVCFIDLDVFKNIVRTNADFADAFIRQLSRDGIFNYARFISLTQKNMHGRIADGLLYLHKSIFNDRNFEIRISRQDLAEMTGMSKDSVIRTLKELDEDGVIKLSQRSIFIIDMKKLDRICELG